MTGLHVVADIYCNACDTRLGWKYVEAFEESQKYKEGKFILEKAMILREEELRQREKDALAREHRRQGGDPCSDEEDSEKRSEGGEGEEEDEEEEEDDDGEDGGAEVGSTSPYPASPSGEAAPGR